MAVTQCQRQAQHGRGHAQVSRDDSDRPLDRQSLTSERLLTPRQQAELVAEEHRCNSVIVDCDGDGSVAAIPELQLIPLQQPECHRHAPRSAVWVEAGGRRLLILLASTLI